MHWLDRVIEEQDEIYAKRYGISPARRRQLFDASAEFTEQDEVECKGVGDEHDYHQR